MFQNQISNLGSFQGVQLESDIAVITLDDNISHTYCSKIKWEQDNYLPIGIAKIIMPYSSDIARYWVKYSGAVVIHANLNSHENSVTNAMLHNLPSTTSLNMKKAQEAKKKAEESNKNSIDTDKKKVKIKEDKHKKKISIKNDFYNYSFIGKVSRFKQIGKTFVVYLEDLGWKFLQKVPKDFRDTYIAGQSLDNAFQAICEFMGVEFAYSIEDLSGYTFSTDGYSIQKDGKVIEDVPSILKEWGKSEEEEEELSEDEKMAESLKEGQPFEAQGLGNYLQKKAKAEAQKKTNNDSLNAQVTNNTSNTNNQTSTDQNQQQQEQQNNPIEKIEQYQEEFDEKIKDLFIGNTFYDSNISDPILNYDWITVTPQVATTSTTTSTNTTQNPNDPNAQNQNSTTNNNGTNSNQNQQNTTQS